MSSTDNELIELMLSLKRQQYRQDIKYMLDDLKSMGEYTGDVNVSSSVIVKTLYKLLQHNVKTTETRERSGSFMMNSSGSTTIEDDILSMWAQVRLTWREGNVDTWSQLRNYEYEHPKLWTIYKKQYNPSRPQLRYCMCDFLVGFYNPTDEPLILEFGTHDAIIKLTIPEHSFQSAMGKYPLYIGYCLYQDFYISCCSHDNFMVLYVWAGPQNRNSLLSQSFSMETNSARYALENGRIVVANNSLDNLPEFPLQLDD